jgi:hypothetical protein
MGTKKLTTEAVCPECKSTLEVMVDSEEVESVFLEGSLTAVRNIQEAVTRMRDVCLSRLVVAEHNHELDAQILYNGQAQLMKELLESLSQLHARTAERQRGRS